jgi:hypothetical protein
LIVQIGINQVFNKCVLVWNRWNYQASSVELTNNGPDVACDGGAIFQIRGCLNWSDKVCFMGEYFGSLLQRLVTYLRVKIPDTGANESRWWCKQLCQQKSGCRPVIARSQTLLLE